MAQGNQKEITLQEIATIIESLGYRSGHSIDCQCDSCIRQNTLRKKLIRSINEGKPPIIIPKIGVGNAPS